MPFDIETWGSTKQAIVELTGLSRDVLHVYVGLALTAVTGLLGRLEPRDWRLLLVPLALVCFGEVIDVLFYMRGDVPREVWLEESWKDLLNTMLVPLVLVLVARNSSRHPRERR